MSVVTSWKFVSQIDTNKNRRWRRARRRKQSPRPNFSMEFSGFFLHYHNLNYFKPPYGGALLISQSSFTEFNGTRHRHGPSFFQRAAFSFFFFPFWKETVKIQLTYQPSVSLTELAMLIWRCCGSRKGTNAVLGQPSITRQAHFVISMGSMG